MNRNGKHGARYGTKEKETKKFFGRISFRTFALSLVALIQIALLLVGATYSWVETISSIKFEGAKGNIETAVKKLVNISDDGGTISLDNYFREAGDVHLAACSSADGKDFYFPIIVENNKNNENNGNNETTNTNKYRKGTINDKNVNYIDFDFEIKNTTETEKQYTFNTVPNVEDDVRVAIYLDGDNNETQIFSNKASTKSVVSYPNGKTATQTVKNFGDYKHGNTGGNSIFKVSPKGEVKVKVKIWLQEGGSSTSNTVSINDLALICGESQKTVTVKYGKDCDSSMGDIYLNNDKKLSKAFCDKDSTVTLCSDANTNSTDIAPYGYKFMGWYNDYECTDPATDLNENQFTMKDSSKEFYAKFKKICKVKVVVTQTRPDKKTYLGSVTLDGKKGVSLSTQKYACGETVEFSVSPIAGYEFVGWYSTSDFVGDSLGKESPKSVNLSEDKTSYIYYAKFLPKEVTVTATVKDNIGGKINFGDETDIEITTKVNYDSSITFSTKASTTDVGYVFAGWYKDSECSAIISNKTSCTVDVNKEEQLKGVQIYAKFRLKQYEINLNAKSFYNNTEIEDTNKKYGKVSYTIDGGTQADADTSKTIYVEYGKKLVLNAEPGEYCDFVGWYSDEGLKTEITDKNNHTPKLSGDDGTTFSYYAKFSVKSKKFTVSVPEVYSDYGKVYIGTDESSVTSGTFKYGDEVTLTAKAKENYKFAGWYTNSNCTGDPIKDSENNVVGENYTFTVDKSTKDNYYAKFEIKTKKISVNCKNDTGDTTSSVKIMLGNVDKGASGTFNYGEKITLVATPGSNYEVEAWYMDANYSQTVLSSQGKTKLSLTVGDSTSETYYVKLVKKAKSISVSCKPDNQYGTSTAVIDNGTAQGTTTYSCEYGSEITLVATPDDKHTFVGWYSDSNCEGSAINTSSSYSITVDNDTKDNYYAKFEYKQKTITIDISKTSDNTVSERWAAYVWNTAENKSDWIDIKNNTFTVSLYYDRLIICRMNGSKTENNWDNLWNQTSETGYEISKGSKFTSTGWIGKYIDGTWKE